MEGWNYDLENAPADNRRILGLWLERPGAHARVRIIWRAEKPEASYRYLTHDGSDHPHYVDDPHAFALMPPIRKPRKGPFRICNRCDNPDECMAWQNCHNKSANPSGLPPPPEEYP